MSASSLGASKPLSSLFCKICEEQYNEQDREPRILGACLHTLCTKCLMQIAQRALTAGRNTFECPFDRSENPIPNPLNPSAFKMNFALLDVLHEVQQSSIVVDSPNNISQCSVHPPNPLQMFCKQCKTPLCNLCLCLDHKDHSFGLLAAETKPLRNELGNTLESIKKARESYVETSQATTRSLDQYQKVLAEKKTLLHRTCEEIKDLLALAEASTVASVEADVKVKESKAAFVISQLLAQEERLKKTEKQLEEVLNKTDSEVALSYRKIVGDAKEAVNQKPVAGTIGYEIKPIEGLLYQLTQMKELFPKFTRPPLSASAPIQTSPQSNQAAREAFLQYEMSDRSVFFFRVDSKTPLASLKLFTAERNIKWFVPKSDEDLQRVITTVTFGVTSDPNARRIGGYVTGKAVDDQHDNHSEASICDGKGFTAFRKQSCSFGNPNKYGFPRCWDVSHEYDWLVCESCL